jgi:hypothetical protein
MNFVNENQLALLLLCLVTGCIGTAFLLFRRVPPRAWKVIDLLWTTFGGLGTAVAIVAGIYRADTSRLDRQIDRAFTATGDFDRDAARFRLGHCEVDHPSPTFRVAIRSLCEKVEFLSASTAENSALPVFVSATRHAAPLSGLALFGRAEIARMHAPAADFEPAMFLVFAAEDEGTRDAVSLLRAAPSTAGIAAEYQVIARSYTTLVEEVKRLDDEWTYLQSHANILTLQVLALCLVGFVAPFRVGKAIADLA